jgi:hypothetical protein
MATDSKSVGTPSPAYMAMAKRWELIDDLLGGTQRMRDRATAWLPREEAERDSSYAARINRSFLYGALEDTIVKLKSKPFAKPVKLAAADALPDMLKLIEADTDRCNASLTQFAASVFESAAKRGLAHILVDYPPLGGGQRLDEEARLGAHPYFCLVDASCLIGWQSVVDEKSKRETLMQIRIREKSMESEGEYGQAEVERIRVITPTEWVLYRQQKGGDYVEESRGINSLGRIALSTVYFRRSGFMTADPPLESLAWANLEHWQSSSEQRNVLHVARVPILYEQGVTEEMMSQRLVVAAGKSHRTSAQPTQSDLRWVEHSGTSIAAGQTDLEKIEERMQILGLQPLLDTAARTATEIGVGEGRTHAAIKAWIGSLNDGLYDAYALAGEWIGEELPEDFAVDVHSAFELDARADTDMLHLLQMRAAGEISRERFLKEAQRRGKFGEDFDVQKELESEGEPGAVAPMSPEERAAIQMLREQREKRRGTEGAGAQGADAA